MGANRKISLSVAPVADEKRTTQTMTRTRSRKKSNQPPKIDPLPVSRAILPSMQSIMKPTW